MKTAIMKNWSIQTTQNGFKAPEQVGFVLVGEIHEDSAERFDDGDPIRTTRIRDVVNHGDYKTVETNNTMYTVRPEDIDPDYEKAYPGAYERLSIEKRCN